MLPKPQQPRNFAQTRVWFAVPSLPPRTLDSHLAGVYLDAGNKLSAATQVRVPDQAHRQEHTEKPIKRQAEARPPVRHAGVVDEQMMNEVKNPVPNKGSDYEPEISSKAEDGNQQKAACNCAFNDQSAAGSSHRSEQHIVGSNHDQHGRIKSTFPVKAD